MAESLNKPVPRLFLIDKPAGISSFSALGNLKRAIGTKKVGHAGTLDPFATGLLVALSGKMTKAAALFENLDKEYEATFRLGAETDTLDTEGTVIAEAAVPPLRDIESAAGSFRGDLRQLPPAYSAVKIDGKRAYRLAREGAAPAMPERSVNVSEFEILAWNDPLLDVRIRCSKGTYIRSIARDLGLASGSRAYCSMLRRTAIGPFRAESSLDSVGIAPADGIDPLSAFRSLDIPILEVDGANAEALRRGVPFGRIEGVELPDRPFVCLAERLGSAAALMKRDGRRWSYSIVFD